MDEGVPVLGVHIFQTDDYIPPELAGKKVIRWTWDGVATWVGKL